MKIFYKNFYFKEKNVEQKCAKLVFNKQTQDGNRQAIFVNEHWVFKE